MIRADETALSPRARWLAFNKPVARSGPRNNDNHRRRKIERERGVDTMASH